MKILFFGRGVIGTLYAFAFEKAGHSVEFYVRAGRKAQYGSYIDLDIIDTRQKKTERRIKEKWPVVFREDIPKGHGYDLIFVSTNPEQVADALAFIAPRAEAATVLIMGNFWEDLRLSSQPLPFDRVIWGSPGGGGGYEGNKLYGGLYKTVHLGKRADAPAERELAVQKLFAGAGFKAVLQKDIQDFLRNHFIMNAAMEISVLKRGGFKAAASSREALTDMAYYIREMLPVVKAKGSKLDAQGKLLSVLPPKLFGLMMSKLVFAPGTVPYALIEHNHYQAGAAVMTMIADARRYGIAAPRLFAAESLK